VHRCRICLYWIKAPPPAARGAGHAGPADHSLYLRPGRAGASGYPAPQPPRSASRRTKRAERRYERER
jgi:hypothetical protein